MLRPHSNFDFTDDLIRQFDLDRDVSSLRRAFTLARMHDAKCFTTESIKPEGSIQDEVETLRQHLSDYEPLGLIRYAFWCPKNKTATDQNDRENCGIPLGYAIFKVDRFRDSDGKLVTRGHIFEAVFKKHPHENNCIAFPRDFEFRVGDQIHSVSGFLYCQQGPCHKSCAHVAIRSVVMSLGTEKDLFYSRVNQLAGQPIQGPESPGLNSSQILKVLRCCGVQCDALEYEKAWNGGIQHTMHLMERFSSDLKNQWKPIAANEIRITLKRSLFAGFKERMKGTVCLDRENAQNLLNLLKCPEEDEEEFIERMMEIQFDISDFVGANWNRKPELDFPYQKFLYAGVEAGGAALVGFDLALPEGESFASHIVPFFGHTFNQDAWVPMAENAYFTMGSETRYISSHSWLSSFLMHDDNFGPNFCVPKDYLDPSEVRFAVTIRREGTGFGGVDAEAIALDCVLSVSKEGLLENRQNAWTFRLLDALQRGNVVLRSVAITRDEYAEHLAKVQDWEGNYEDEVYPKIMGQILPQMIWLVEISIPELFPGNKRKIGEVVLDATISEENLPSDKFLSSGLCRLIRLPEWYLFSKMEGDEGGFDETPSLLTTHVDLFRHSKEPDQ